MNCESAQNDFPLFLYGELPLERERELRSHVAACAVCGAELERQERMQRLLSAREQAPAPELLARCRSALSGNLQSAPTPGWSARLRRMLEGRIEIPGLVPRLGGALAFMGIGFLIARISFPGAALAPVPPGVPEQPPAAVATVRGIRPDPSGNVHILVDETRQRVVTGSPEDEQIRQLLVAAAREGRDPRVRAQSVDLLRSRPDAAEVQSVMMHALERDPNAGVRLKALQALKPFAGDPEVRDALSRALLEDNDPTIRTEAVDVLTKDKRDAIVGILQEAVQRDADRDVRQRCKRALEDMNASVGTF